jgi:hypothetical protein
MTSAVRQVAFALALGIVVGSLCHLAECARHYYFGSARYLLARADGSQTGFIEYAMHADRFVGIGMLALTFVVTLAVGPGDWRFEG